MRKLVVAIVAGCLGSALAAQPSSAADIRFPTKARTYTAWMVRAFDQCIPSGTTVVGLGLPSVGCIATVSDPLPPGAPLGATMNFAKLTLRRFPGSFGGDGRIKLTGRGFQGGQRVSVRLTLRTTRSGVATLHPPTSNSTVTFVDTTIDCGNQSANCFVARQNGAIAGSQTLKDCLVRNGEQPGLTRENLQVIDAALINCDTGLTVAVPGILN